MAHKELGQIHTVNFFDTISAGSGNGPRTNLDLPGELTSQLQKMVRAGTYMKVTGIDMTLTTEGTVGGGQLSGHIRYYAPTEGRCEAYKGAFLAMKNVMEEQGIDFPANKLYDFRAPINAHNDASNPFRNQATLGSAAGGLVLYDSDPAGEGRSIFTVHNRSQQPTAVDTPAGDLFPPGFDTVLSTAYEAATGNTMTDFVLNDTAIWTGEESFADTEYEKIPFMLSWTPDSTDIAVQFNWRPDPALYLAVLCGQMQVYIEEINVDSEAPGLELNIAVHVAGWKSIMGSRSYSRKRSTRNYRKGRK